MKKRNLKIKYLKKQKSANISKINHKKMTIILSNVLSKKQNFNK